MIRNALDLSRDEIGGDIFDLSGRNATVNSAGFDPRSFQHHGAGRDDRIPAYHRIVHDNRSHSHQNAVFDRATMDDGIMSDGNVVSDMDIGFLIGGVNDDAILYIYLVANVNAANVTPEDGVEPDAALISDLYLAYHGCVRSQEAIFAKTRGFALYRKDSGHIAVFSNLRTLRYQQNSGRLGRATARLQYECEFVRCTRLVSPAPCPNLTESTGPAGGTRGRRLSLRSFREAVPRPDRWDQRVQYRPPSPESRNGDQRSGRPVPAPDGLRRTDPDAAGPVCCFACLAFAANPQHRVLYQQRHRGDRGRDEARETPHGKDGNGCVPPVLSRVDPGRAQPHG